MDMHTFTHAHEHPQTHTSTHIHPPMPSQTYTKITSDGTYATQSVFISGNKQQADDIDSKTPLRSLLMKGDWYLATILSSCLVKLVFHLDR